MSRCPISPVGARGVGGRPRRGRVRHRRGAGRRRPAASPHRAAVIVDTGGSVHRVVDHVHRGLDHRASTRCSGPARTRSSISSAGRAARSAASSASAATPGPTASAGGDGDTRYWAYFRAPGGDVVLHVLVGRGRQRPRPRRRRRGLEVRHRQRAAVRVARVAAPATATPADPAAADRGARRGWWSHGVRDRRDCARLDGNRWRGRARFRADVLDAAGGRGQGHAHELGRR